VTGARVVVDSSKNVFFAKLLTETSGLRITLLHLVRDSRGVAYSWMRRQERPGTNGRREHFRVVGPVMGSILWTGANLMTEWTGRRTERRHFMRYEDFVAAPAATLRALLDALDAPADPARLSHVNGRAVRLGVDHLIASNPNRRRRGDIELREDERWRHEMGAGRRSLVTGMTLPLLRRYGYQLRPGPPVAARASKRTQDETA
jgi:hypothetical protein